jgi:hypothetical protein
MKPGRAFSVMLLLFYLFVAGALPAADAVVERAGAFGLTDQHPSDDRTPAPAHDGCPVCALIDRILPVTPDGGAQLSAIVVSFDPHSPRSASPHPPASPHAPLHAARAPPLS